MVPLSDLIGKNYETISKRKRRHVPEDSSAPTGVFEAADALTALISLVYSFIFDDKDYISLANKLLDIDGEIGELETAIIDGYLDENLNDNSLYISSLISFSEELYNYDFEIKICSIWVSESDEPPIGEYNDDEDVDDEPLFVREKDITKLDKALEYFVHEIARRTFELSQICTGAIIKYQSES